VTTINGRTKLYGVLGHPVGHSLSPAMHNAAFRALGINAVYVAMDITEVKHAIRGLKSLGFGGVSVTIPHKEAVIPHLTAIDQVARDIGAVNSIAFIPQGNGEVEIRGYNTDWIGANRALEKHVRLKGAKALIIGAGGAAKAVGFGLREAGAEVMITNRTIEKGEKLAKWLDCPFISRQGLEHLQGDILINTTSVGMEPYPADIPIEPRLVGNYGTVMDIVYAPLTTRLLAEARNMGCTGIDGLDMLLYQGAAQFEIWTGKLPDVQVMRAAMEDELARRSTGSE
jgi:shikimate dehydrogenase